VFYVAIRPFGGGWSEVADVITRPLVSGILSVGAAWLIAQSIESTDHGRLPYLFQFALICLVSVILNALLARFWMRPIWDDLLLRIRRMLPVRAAA
jgi:hypothetical protein